MAAEADVSPCVLNWKPNYEKGQVYSICRKTDIKFFPNCKESLNSLIAKKESYQNEISKDCLNIPKPKTDPVDGLEALDEKLKTNNAAISAIDGILAKNQQLRKNIAAESRNDFSSMGKLAGARSEFVGLRTPSPGKVNLSKVSNKWGSILRSGTDDPSLPDKLPDSEKQLALREEPKAESQFVAVQNRASFISSLVSQSKDLVNLKSSFLLQNKDLENRKLSLGPGDGTGGQGPGGAGPGGNDSTADQKSPSSGFDPSSLMGLAGPLMGLLAPKPKTPDSGLSTPATSTTPPLPQTPSARLNSAENKKPANGGFSLTPDEKKTTTPSSGGDNMGSNSYGGYEAPQSDVSPKNSSGSSGAPLGVSSAGGPAGSGGNKEEEKREPAAAPLMAKGEEGFPGGGGDAGYGGGSHSAEEAPAEHESPMKEVLNDMETAIDGGTPNWGSEEGQAAEAEPGVATEDSGSLFPRVSACYARSLKKGLVLNGLGEKIEE